MYLKELTLKGFKSFASATTLRFEPGITAVVGPNGSGKSNIVDALTWVMGEQGAKNLRGASMEDVIFAGTASRPPLGRAQVLLTIDNTDHALDIDYTEVTISRTIFRNGGSEYAINGSPCRLLDIQELLSDTGLGQQMHVIVGQGRLDQILKADPAGHRAFIEEAAGILKHRKRKERALRKLAGTKDNIARLDDLLGEIRRQLGPLGRQARVSRRAAAIQIALRDAQSRLLADDAVAITDRRRDVHEELGAVRARLAETQGELARVKMRIEQVETQVGQSNPAIDRVDRTWRSLSRIRERFAALASLAEERERSLAGRIAGMPGEDPDLLEARAAELERQGEHQTGVVNDLRMALDQATEQRAGDEKRLASIRQTLTELRRTARERDGRMAHLRELIAREESGAQAGDARIADLESQRGMLRDQRRDALDQWERLRDDAEPDRNAGGQELDEARAHLAECREALESALDEQRNNRTRIVSLTAKADALADALAGRNASGALTSGGDVAVLGRLSDFIHVAEGWEDAVARSLGPYAGALVVPDADDMLHALDRARRERLGRAAVIRLADEPLPPGDDGADPADGTDVDGTDMDGSGVDGTGVGGTGEPTPLAGLVTPNPDAPDAGQASRAAATVRLLLHDVVAVESSSQAQRLASATSRADVVTHDGASFRAGVAATGGSASAQSDLALAARRTKALGEIRRLEAEAARIQRKVDEAKQVSDEAAARVDACARRRTELKLKAEQAAASLAQAKRRLDGLERQLVQTDDRLDKARDEQASHRARLDDLAQALHAAETAGEGEASADDLTTREHELEAALAAARDQEVATKIAWSEATRTSESLRRQCGLLRSNAKEARERRSRIESANARLKAQASHARAVGEDARAMTRIVDAAIARTVTERDRLRAQLSGHDEELKALRVQRDAIEPKVRELTDREHSLDVDRERIAAEYGQVAERAREDLGLGLDELIREYGPDRPVPVLDDDGNAVMPDGPGPVSGGGGERDGGAEGGDGTDAGAATADGAAPRIETVPYVRAEQAKRLEQAKRDLARLGKVNPLAAEEYEALAARNKYLNDQRDDVMRSRDDLLKLVKDLDATMTDVFRTAFNDTAKAFEQMFDTLFPGGKGRLRLEDPDDLLSTGVIVEASPAGKRVRQLSLLSGGERSLTALALLFAIFSARPSPFYVMDEVEAALDDVNLTRLLDAIERLREHAQLIVITHQQRTMSIADALYGVTMRVDGVTAVASQRLPRQRA